MTRRVKGMRLDLDSSTNAMARGAAVNLVGAMGANVVALGFNFVITHVVSVDRIGLLSIGATVVSLATIPALLGLETGTVRFVARGAAAGDERAAAGSLQLSIALAGSVSAVLAAVLWVKAPWVCNSFFHKPEAVGLMRIVAISLPALTLGRVLLAGIQGYGVMSYGAWLGPLRGIVNLAAAVPLLALGLGATGLAIAGDVTAFVLTALTFAMLLRVHPRALVPAPDHWHMGRLLRFSLPQTMTAMLFFAIVWTDTLLVGRFRTAAEVGVYTIVGRLLTPATLVSTAVGQMFAPRIAAQDALGDRATLATMLKRVTYWNTAVSIPFFALLIVAPAPLLSLFGPRYASGAAALSILAAGQLLNTAAGPLGQVINLSGRPYVTLLNNGFVAAINIAVCLVLIPRYGLAGAATGTAIALTLVNLIKLVEVRVLLGMYPFRDDSVRALFAAGLASALATPFVFLISWPNALVETLVIAVLLFAGYVRFAFALGISDENRELFDAGRARVHQLLRTMG